MLLAISSGFLIGGFALFIIYFVLLVYSNSLIDKPIRNHLRNSFPYNFYMDFSIKTRFILYVILALSGTLIAIGECMYMISFSTSYMYFISIFLPLSIIGLLISNLIPLSHYKTHIIAAFVGFGCLSLSTILLTFAGIVEGTMESSTQINLTIRIFLGIIGFVSFFALFNPKLLNWSKMDKTEEDGKTIYVKPKFNFLALYEWIYLILSYFVSFLLMINLFIQSSN